MKIKKIIALLFFCALCNGISRGQVFVNGGFEFKLDENKPAGTWTCSSGSVVLDSMNKYLGNFSCHYTRDSFSNSDSQYGVIFTAVPSWKLSGKKILFKGRVYCPSDNNDSVVKVFAQIIDSTNPYDKGDIRYGNSVVKYGEWDELSISLELEQLRATNMCYFGFTIDGSADIWIDDIEIYADDQLLDYSPRTEQLTELEFDWLRNNIIEVYPELIDIERFSSSVGDARVVGIGENVHGSAKIKFMASHLITYLIEHKGFNVIAYEGWTDAMASNANSYLNNSDPYSNYKEEDGILWLRDWIKQYNKTARKKVRYEGIDLIQVESIIDEIDDLVDSELYSQTEILRKIFLPIIETMIFKENDFNFKIEEKADVRNAIALIIEWGHKNIPEQNKINNLLYNVAMLEALLEYNDSTREIIISNKIKRLTEIDPDDRIIFIAHNEHIRKNGSIRDSLPRSGSYLNKLLGESYFSIGTCFYQGNHMARQIKYVDSTYILQEPDIYTLPAAMAGSYEYLFNSLDVPFFYLPINHIIKKKGINDWLFDTLQWRSIGDVPEEYGFYPYNLSDSFDAILFIKTSQATFPKLKEGMIWTQ